MSTDLPRLRRLLGGPDLAWLVDRVRRRLEAGQSLDSTVTRPGAGGAERAALGRLLGRAPRPGRSLSVPLAAVDTVLRDSGACTEGLAAAVVALTGPVTPRRDAAERLASAWQRAFAPLADTVSAHPQFTHWHAELHATGLVRRLARTPEEAAPILATLARLLPHLPVSPPRSLSAFAAEYAEGAHALDHGPLATLTLDAVRALTGAAPGSDAQSRRAAWAAAGLLLDELSSQVLTLNLPGDNHTATGRALSALGACAQPAVLTLRQLVRDPPRLCLPPIPAGQGGPRRGSTAYVCENPAVVLSAADGLGRDCAPLICLQGQPSTAALHLLRLCADAGWALRYHGDFDWGGLRIAGRLRAHVPWTPWRYTTADYLAALAGHPASAPLTGPAADSPWDPPLAEAVRAAGRRIEEELVLDHLLLDLGGHDPQDA
ncbi:TIGR02679 family protein [Streptomyces montanisoli]|uniref:TIGR02679 family protein n=1 Tax=Streptomyces montanisoli TaxID=2798581 RepID=A0A940MB89_9ACTN|nr:TIGR02679 family protein [Streptomyces montanisoli]MBP0456477.1 TIGR02679 family protein [Streptomyces montanisoli]